MKKNFTFGSSIADLKFWNLFREGNIVTDNLNFMKWGEIEFDLENYISEYKLDCVLCNWKYFYKERTIYGRTEKNVESNSWRK